MRDSQLLEQFIVGQDEAAFRALVLRHGPTVLRVCRRILRDPHEIEDAFQATFLVLVRRAPSIRDPESLSSWLHGVAYRVAKRARRAAARRRDHERRSGEMGASRDGSDPTWDDLGQVVREELNGLPENYRLPLDLCYLGGLSHEQIASQLGWPLGTVKTRLVRGRKQLREQLDRRGVKTSLGLLLLLLLPPRAEAVPPELAEATIEAMMLDSAAVPGPAAPRYVRVSRLARECILMGIGGRSRLGPLAALLVALLAASGSASLYGAQRVAETEEFAALPASLSDVLRATCR